MDAAPRAMRSGIAAAVMADGRCLVGWALFFGGAPGTGATASLGSAAAIVAALLLVGWSRGLVSFPFLDRRGSLPASQQ